MKFRTEINIVPSINKITHRDPVMLIGSCFTDNIGKKLESFRFQTNINPFGVVYNPMSVKRSLEILISDKEYTPDDLEYFNDLWYSWDHHSSFSGEDREKVLAIINQKNLESSQFLKNSKYLFLSFGTSWIYRLIKNGRIVCNCHKVPAKEFSRELLNVEEIVSDYKNLLAELKNYNPQLRIIFTVSPVRHWKDGAHGNQLSKSVLHLAIHHLLHLFPEETEYFPSYELMLDDLRDYRFYAEDLLHPNEQGIHYLWEKFSDQYFTTETTSLMSEIQDIVRASGHRFSNRNSKHFKEFKKTQLEKLSLIKMKLPYLNWTELEEGFC